MVLDFNQRCDEFDNKTRLHVKDGRPQCRKEVDYQSRDMITIEVLVGENHNALVAKIRSCDCVKLFT